MTVSVRPRRLYLIDTSAHARVADRQVARVIGGLILDRGATCVTVDLDAGYSGRNYHDVREISRRRRDHYVNLPITEAIADRARDTQLRMASRGHHRAAGIVVVITAAIAEHHGAVILHYDTDFEHIAAVTGQPHTWVVPRGSVD